MKKPSAAHVFLVLVALSLFAGSAFERAAEALIIDQIAPRVFLSGVIFMAGYLLLVAWEGLTSRGSRRATAEELSRSTLEVILVLGCATAFTAYSGMRIADHLGAGDYRFLLERAIDTRGNSCAVGELDGLVKQFGDLKSGQVMVVGLQNAEFKLRDYWRTVGAREIVVALVADGSFESRPAVGSFLEFVRALALSGEERRRSVRVIGVAGTDGSDVKGVLGGGAEVIPLKDSLLSRAATGLRQRHYQSLVGRLGTSEVVFVLAPNDQYGNDYAATFYIRPREERFRELSSMLDEIELVADHMPTSTPSDR